MHAVADRDVLTEGRPSARLLRPLTKLGADEWGTLGEIRHLNRIPYEEPAPGSCRASGPPVPRNGTGAVAAAAAAATTATAAPVRAPNEPARAAGRVPARRRPVRGCGR